MHKKSLLLGLLFPLISSAAIYQSTDQNGTINFSDTLQSGASIVSVSEENYSSDIKLPATKIDLNTQDTAIEINKPYKTLVILQPKNDATFLSNKGNLKVSMELKPKLRAKDKLIVLLDNKVTDNTQHNSIITIANIDRGTHTLQLQIQDATGRTLLTSESVTFHMQRPMIREVKIQNAN